MSAVTITLNTDNDAFVADAGSEVARILRTLADRFEDGIGAGTVPLKDGNGNTVGSAVVE
jgi:hypothetical protein